jgi:Ala-tRNA(Pro) deacylase
MMRRRSPVVIACRPVESNRRARLILKEEAMAIPASISEFLGRHHARYSLMPHPIAYTAQEEAAAAHVPGREWAKVVVCMADDHPCLAVLPATSKVDFDRLKRAANAGSLRLANENELKDLYTECEVGAMPPFGPLYRQPVFVDESLTEDEQITFNGGSHRDAIRMRFGEFERLVRPTVAAFGMGLRSVTSGSAPVMVTDAVCGTELDERNAWGRSDYQGGSYHFCSQHCKMEFDDNPQAYARWSTKFDA